MRQPTSSKSVVFLTVGLLAGCGATPDDEVSEALARATLEVTAAPIRPDSVVARTKLPTGSWTRWGTIPGAEPWERPPEVTEDATAPSVPESPEGDLMAIGDPHTGNVFSVRFAPAELEAITLALEGLGFAQHNAGDFPTDEEDGFIQKGWSNGTDNRSPFGIHAEGSPRSSLFVGP